MPKLRIFGERRSRKLLPVKTVILHHRANPLAENVLRPKGWKGDLDRMHDNGQIPNARSSELGNLPLKEMQKM